MSGLQHDAGYGTSIFMNWSPINQAYMVWRDDSGYQSDVRIYNEKEFAVEEFETRRNFLKMVNEAKELAQC